MKIIKQGRKGLVFKCPFCKCKFEANLEECNINENIFFYNFYINCPNCKFKLHKQVERK